MQYPHFLPSLLLFELICKNERTYTTNECQHLDFLLGSQKKPKLDNFSRKMYKEFSNMISNLKDRRRSRKWYLRKLNMWIYNVYIILETTSTRYPLY